jgi:hypothetical protein
MARKGWASQCPLRSESGRSAASSRPDVKCVFRDADTLCGKLSNARFWRVFASLSGLCLGQSWLGQSPKRCACVAGWNVCTTRSKDVIRVAVLGGDHLDDRLGVARICFCALRNVETSPRPDCKLRSARPRIAADRGARCSDELARRTGHRRLKAVPGKALAHVGFGSLPSEMIKTMQRPMSALPQ